jgi:hypothetical protein
VLAKGGGAAQGRDESPSALCQQQGSRGRGEREIWRWQRGKVGLGVNYLQLQKLLLTKCVNM